MAEDLDQMSQEERLSKPLFGIPISVKENYMIQVILMIQNLALFINSLPFTSL